MTRSRLLLALCALAFAMIAPAAAMADQTAVNTATGYFSASQTDLSLPGVGVPFTWTRTYNGDPWSNGDPIIGNRDQKDYDEPLGPGWKFNYQTHLEFSDAGDVTVESTTGSRAVYIKDGSDFIPPPGVRAQLTEDSGVYTLRQPNGIKSVYDDDGRLTAMVDRHDQGLTMHYGGSGAPSGELSSITDSAGREIEITWESLERGPSHILRITGVELPDGRSVHYEYGFLFTVRLISVTDVRGNETDYAYDGATTDGPALNNLLTSITDQNSHVVVANTYDGLANTNDRRVTEQEDAVSGTRTFDYSGTDSDGYSVTTITDADEAEHTDAYSGYVLVKQENANAGASVYGYDSRGNRSSVEDPRGIHTDMVYDAHGNLTEISNATTGNTETRTYDGDDNLLTVTDPRGETTTRTYTGGDLTSIENPDGGTTTFSYLGNGLLDTATDPRGNTTSYSYDADGNRTGAETELGKTVSYTWDESGRMASMTDANGETTSYGYDEANHLTSSTDRRGKETTYEFDPAGNLVTQTDPALGETTYAYDDANRVTSVTDPLSNTTSYGYDAVGNLVSETSPTGALTTRTYDGVGNLLTTVSPRGNQIGADPEDFTWTYAYDANNNLATSTDPLGNETEFTYDAENRQVGVTDPLGHTTETGYDEAGNVTSTRNGALEETTFTYDEVGRPLTTTSPEGRTKSREYDLAGNLVATEDQDGNRTTFSYDDDGRLEAMVDPRGNEIGADPEDFTWSYTYDDGGRLIETEDPLGHTTATTYNEDDQVASQTDENANTTSYAYNDRGDVASVTAPGSATTSFSYDADGRLTGRTDPNSHTTAYAYDDDGRPTSVADPLDNERSFEYDADGNLTRTITARGNAAVGIGEGRPTIGDIDRSYDRAGRLVAVDYGDSTPDLTFTYDEGGRLVQMDDGPGTETYDYDDADRLTEVTRGSDTFAYGYDDDGLPTSRTYPDSTVVTSTYDNEGRLASTSVGGATTDYGYDAAGDLTTTTLPSGTGFTSTRDYDAAGRLVSVENADGSGTLSGYERTLDPVGNPTRIDTTRGATTTSEALTYDTRNRLTTWCPGVTSCSGATSSVAFSYDPVGNRTQDVRTGVSGAGTTNYTYNAADRLTQTVKGITTTNFTYDEDGNQIAAGTSSASYDLENRMKAQTIGGVTTSYLYDGVGKRLRATTGAAQTRFVWDSSYAQPELVIERDASDALVRRYTPGIGGSPLGLYEGGDDYWYMTDPIGSVSDLVDDSGDAQLAYAYEPFGAATETQVSLAPPVNPLRFTGEYQDPSGDLHLRARQYDPDTGRFNGVDPVSQGAGDAAGSSYAYVGNRPGMFTDPSGMIPNPISAVVSPVRTGWSAVSNYVRNDPSAQFLHGEAIGAGLLVLNTGATAYGYGKFALTHEPGETFNHITHPCSATFAAGGDKMDCFKDLSGYTQAKAAAVATWNGVQNGCSPEDVGESFGQVLGIGASYAVPATRALGAAGRAGPAIARSGTILRERLANRTQVGSFTPGAWFSRAGADEDFVVLHHGSRDNFSRILRDGLATDRGTTWASRDLAAARDAIDNGYDGAGPDSGVVTSRIPKGELDKLRAAQQRADLGADYFEDPNYPGFSRNLSSSEFVMRSNAMIELFNRYIVR